MEGIEGEDPLVKFSVEVGNRILSNRNNTRLLDAAKEFMAASTGPKYSYNFRALGRPIIQYPQDITAIQEIIWSVRPDLIIETGIAHGGSLIQSAHMLATLDLADALATNQVYDPNESARRVVAIDIDIRRHNLSEIEAHPFSRWITMLEGSSIDPIIVEEVAAIARNHSRVMVLLDSNHTHEHVLAELRAYAHLVSRESYIVVFDTIIEDLPQGTYLDRPWGPRNSPKSAVKEFLSETSEFYVDEDIDSRLLISVANGGYLRRK